MRTAAELELDLDVFSGPFDLLLTLVLREEIDLLEVDLADVVLAYLDHLEGRGELVLEFATEFLVLISGLLELKSRLMLPGAGDDELVELEPAQAAEELLARMLAHRRYQRFAGPPRWTRRPASTAPSSWARRWVHCCAIRRPSTSTTCTSCTRAC